MRNQKYCYYLILFYIFILSNLSGSRADGARKKPYSIPFNRSSFPAGFIFGLGSSAYQCEGATHMDGRSPSIWDTFTKNHPEKISDGSTGDVADDFYHHYKNDIRIMKRIGLDSFRFSLSWSRLLPKGTIKGGVNPLGVRFYNNVINELLENGLEPFVTLFHWDFPQALEDKYGGFLSSEVVNNFRDYADLCFKMFGDRVKYWVTLNEPNIYSIIGYNNGTGAPGRCSSYVGDCAAGNSATEPYIVGHNLLLSHVAAVKVYKEKYQASQKGQIGITLATKWYFAKTQSTADQVAAYRILHFVLGWFTNPITYGDYPKIMRSIVKNRLPKFTEAESEMLKGSFDFLGMNYYNASYAADSPTITDYNTSYTTDTRVITSIVAKKGIPIGAMTDLSWLFIHAKGLNYLMLYMRKKYKNPPIYITENGIAKVNNGSLSIKEAIKDGLRIKYYLFHLSNLLKAIKQGVNVKAYYGWSFFDNFEWQSGYTVGYGMIYVDFKHELKRHLKYSAYWFQKFLLH